MEDINLVKFEDADRMEVVAHRSVLALKLLTSGHVIAIDECSYGMQSDGTLFFKGTTYMSGQNETAPTDVALPRRDVTLPAFIKMCELMSEEDFIGMVALSAFQKPDRRNLLRKLESVESE